MRIYSADTLEHKTIETDGLYEERDIIFWFDVPKDWAENWCRKNDWDSLKEFDGEYIWDNSWDMYCSAKEDGVVIATREVSNELIYSSNERVEK